ncbi:methionine--tRNA ligase, mitochondrial [Neodiprion lecontei]|uniref:Methionine--tRNA ligase, mitochondrial n=1 Tax=Neodiprion lecontei TaxID=441921 RepID=A0ABM3G5J6_NEOLC|nr:methionine--tRNA ligase, mitochondrial [Neodiprion lecontei]
MALVLFRAGRRLTLTGVARNITIKESARGSRRSIMTSERKLEKALDELKTNPYFEKYAEKISKLQETSPEEFLKKIAEKEKKLRVDKEKREQARKFQQASQAKPSLPGINVGLQKKDARLNDVMKVELIEGKSRDEIIQIWQEYHRQKDCISGAMSAQQYKKLFERGKEYPTFLLPLPRSEGYEFILSQFYDTEIHMTPLLWYQVHKENAPECLSMTHYAELAETKDLVLMRGEFDTKSINVQEAQCLVNELQLYYATDDSDRLRMLEKFTKKPDDFKHMDLIANLETISLVPTSEAVNTSHVNLKCEKMTSPLIQKLLVLNLNKTWKQRLNRHYSKVTSSNFYVTTPIFYVNAGPHIGHLYSAILADSLARYKSMLGYSVQLSTGTDEHGNKVMRAAEASKLPTEQYCKQISQHFKDMCHSFDVGYTEYIRTTEPRHSKALHHFWNVLKENGHIYSGKYSGWYCVADEAFLTTLQLKDIKDSEGKTIKVSIESSHPVEWVEEDNYKFGLSAFQDDLKHWLQDDSVVRPAKFHKILSDWIEEGACLEDLSISRPINRAPWGVPVPEDESQSIYVWLDALVNYLTALGYPEKSYKKFWPPEMQVIGKDILKFHGVYWPAFLMAAGLEPPRSILCHSHWTVDSQKMSKSKGNVISPFDAADFLTADGLRYFLLREAVPYSDANYSKTKAINVVNSELADTFGNLLSRCTGSIINPGKEIPHPAIYVKELQTEAAKSLMISLQSLRTEAQISYEKCNLHHVVDSVMTTLHLANQMVEHHKPWILRKQTDDESKTKLMGTISLALESIRICGLILYPIVPKLSETVLNLLNVPKSKRTWEETVPAFLSDEGSNLGTLATDKPILFKRIMNSEG